MSEKDNGMTAAIFVICIIGCMAIMLFYIVLGILVAGSVFLTVIALSAWNKPRIIDGRIIEPREARAFVIGGLISAGVFGLIPWASEYVFEESIKASSWPYFAVGGYVFGTVGFLLLDAMLGLDKAATVTQTPQATPPTITAIPPRELPKSEFQPFRYASWNDEDGR